MGNYRASLVVLLFWGGSELFAEERDPLRESIVLAKAGRAEAADVVLGRGTFHPQDTFSWRLEVAGRLLQAAFFAQESGDWVAARRLASRALAQLDKIEQGLPPDAALTVNALELRAVIVERFTGTTTEADGLKAEARRRDGREVAAGGGEKGRQTMTVEGTP